MEAEDIMTLKDLPVDTRNYTILDNVTGKPVDQNSYSLTIDPEVIRKLNKLKKVTEEKIKQASLRSTYSDSTLVDTFTPDDNSVFSPLYEGEYIDAQDYNFSTPEQEKEESMEMEQKPKEESNYNPTEVIHQDGILDRVQVRETPPPPPVEEAPAQEESNEVMPTNLVDELPDGTYAPIENTTPVDNSTFNPTNNDSMQQASEQIVKIDAKKLGGEVRGAKVEKVGRERIDLDKMEIQEGRGVAWMAYILFFIPLLFKRNNRFVRLHANSGLKFNLIEIFGGVLFALQFFLTDLTGTLSTVVTLCGVLGLVLLCACAILLLPMIIYAMAGGNFQVPWLWKKRMIHVKTTRD